MLEKDARKILLRRHRRGRYFKLKKMTWTTSLQIHQTPEQQYQPHNHVINSNSGSFTTATNNNSTKMTAATTQPHQASNSWPKSTKNFSLKNDFEGRKREKTFPYDYAILIFRVRKKVKKGSWPPWNVPSLGSPLLLILVVQQVRAAANWDQRGWFQSYRKSKKSDRATRIGTRVRQLSLIRTTSLYD